MKTSRTFSIHFWINSAKIKKNKAPIYARITVNKERIEISLKRDIEVTYWDTRAKRSNSRTPQAKALNKYLDQVYSDLLDCHTQLHIENKIITPKAIKARFLGEDQQQKSLLDIIDYHKTTMPDTLKWGTLKNYDTTEKYLKRFLGDRYKTTDIYLQEITYGFLIDFDQYLRKTSSINRSQPLKNNGIMKHLERLKKLLKLAVNLEWLEKDPSTRFSLKFQKYDREFLSSSELHELEVADFSNDRHRKTRDLFIFSCYTGLSYSDVKALKEKNIVRGIDGKYWIHTHRIKNDQPVKIPLLEKAMVILERYQTEEFNYENNLLPVFSNQKINIYLKEVASLLGINKKLSFHSARHTFATTVTLSNGVPIETVSKLLGHSKLSTTQTYARVMEQKISADMDKLQNSLNLDSIKIKRKQL
ncbi:site-specific integrase [Antarcticibacterium flavum]|uniref:Site-specific integrase n=1 Tax=Antarcticibacterium flavum TaxID=2058175 RepID=A0A5B7X7S9_9FLAO|nr:MULTISPECIES: site-specific integrase [Antarcticibacterium]MCM4161771.1 integrase [Antarcticibacterium sp. W02-3]QCY71150.1 site-specific integrase [Antarcticibacterium flavum]